MWQIFSKYGFKHSSGVILQQSFYYDAHRRKWLYYYVTFETGIGRHVLDSEILDSASVQEKDIHLGVCKTLAIECALNLVRAIEKKLLEG